MTGIACTCASLCRQMFGADRNRRNIERLLLDPPEKLPITSSDGELLMQHRKVSWCRIDGEVLPCYQSLEVFTCCLQCKVSFPKYLSTTIARTSKVLRWVLPQRLWCPPSFLRVNLSETPFSVDAHFHANLLPIFPQILSAWHFEVAVEDAREGHVGAPMATLRAVPMVCGVRMSVQVRNDFAARVHRIFCRVCQCRVLTCVLKAGGFCLPPWSTIMVSGF